MSHLRVLIIDDSLTIRAMIEEMVAREPHSRVVGSAIDVATARQMITDLMPNVITLDLNMPGINGMELLRELRDVAHAPVVVVSSECHDKSEISRLAVELGAKACFDKGKIIREAAEFMRVLKKAADGSKPR